MIQHKSCQCPATDSYNSSWHQFETTDPDEEIKLADIQLLVNLYTQRDEECGVFGSASYALLIITEQLSDTCSGVLRGSIQFNSSGQIYTLPGGAINFILSLKLEERISLARLHWANQNKRRTVCHRIKKLKGGNTQECIIALHTIPCWIHTPAHAQTHTHSVQNPSRT